jgi:hypothetical protein
MMLAKNHVTPNDSQPTGPPLFRLRAAALIQRSLQLRFEIGL